MTHYTSYSLHHFSVDDWDRGHMPFDPADYSLLKFGHNATAKVFGEALAQGFFGAHADALLAKPTVVIPSPFNYIENAATVMTKYFIRRLNHLLVNANGEHVDYSIIHRKVSYTHDYGFMSADQRSSLLSNDKFYLNEGFYRGKNLVFIDDIKITGAHENRLKGILADSEKLASAEAFFVYFAMLTGPCRPEVEAALNFSNIQTLQDYLRLAKEPNHHVIVRPIKFLLGRPPEEFITFLQECDPDTAELIYFGCLGEGYYKIPDYQTNFLALKEVVEAE